MENFCSCVPNPNGQHVIVQLNLASGAQTELVRRSYDETVNPAVAVSNGQVYWAASLYNGTRWDTILHVVTQPGTSQALVQATTDYGMIGVNQMEVINGKIAMSGWDSRASGALLLLYDIAQGTRTLMMPATRAEKLAVGGSYLYMAGIGNVGIARLDLSRDIRPVTPIAEADQFGTFVALGGIYFGEFAYWVENEAILWPSGGWRIVRMRPNGSGYQVLFQSTAELRDPVVVGDRLYFMCFQNCGDPGWVLASVPVTGGTMNPEFLVPNGPHLYAFNEILYVTANDGNASAIFAVNLALDQSQLLVDDLPYTDITLTFSSDWLYWGGENVLGNGMPSRAIARHALQTWNQVGPRQTIVEGVGEAVIDVRTWTIHSNGGYMYYWNRGLKRVTN